MSKREWTTNTPAKAGYYWWRLDANNDCELVCLWEMGKKTELRMATYESSRELLPYDFGEWHSVPVMPPLN
jgi:hypothetical protein